MFVEKGESDGGDKSDKSDKHDKVPFGACDKFPSGGVVEKL
jgi:hypothetical protein